VRVALILAFAIVAAAPTYARVDRICKVAYQTEAGWSDEYKVEVTFVTGRELNKATKSFEYSTFSPYALIWFDQDEVAILEIDSLILGLGSEFDADDFRKLFRLFGSCDAKQVNDRANRVWRITGKTFGRYIDPRADE
jgi:hypothetical protein